MRNLLIPVISVFIFIIVGLIIGNVAWLGAIGLVIGWGISEIIRNKKKNEENTENDERLSRNMWKFYGSTFFFSYVILFLYLIVERYIFDVMYVNIDYMIVYIILTFFILIIGGNIVGKR